jgi:hypothetical protein
MYIRTGEQVEQTIGPNDSHGYHSTADVARTSPATDGLVLNFIQLHQFESTTLFSGQDQSHANAPT